MIADFTVYIHDVDGDLGVRIKVHESLRALHSAVTHSDNRIRSPKKKKYNEHKDTLAICQRFHMQNSTTYAIVRLAPPHIGAGIVAHELAHAAVWLWEIKHKFEEVPIRCDNDEWFCWILGELVRRTTDQMYKNNVYERIENGRRTADPR